MSDILAWGLDVVRFAQRAQSPALTVAMKAVTVLGTEVFFLVAMPLIYWCVDRRRGARIGVLILVSAFVNCWLKLVFAQPRPFDLDQTVGLAHESSHGLPSGHAQSTATFWGAAAPLFGRPWGLVLAIGVPLLVGFTRIYLGVHFPTDLFAGWALGGLFVALDTAFGERLARLLAGLRPALRLAAAAAGALVMNALCPEDTAMAGAFFGFAAGLAYAPGAAPFSSGGKPGAKALRLLVGLLGVAVLYLVPKALLSAAAAHLPLVRFLRYAVVGAWGGLGAPWLFLRLKLAEREGAAQSASA